MKNEIAARKILNNCRGRVLELALEAEGLRLALAELQTLMFGFDNLQPDAYLYDNLPHGRDMVTTKKIVAERQGHSNIRPLYHLDKLHAAADKPMVSTEDESKGLGEK